MEEGDGEGGKSDGTATTSEKLTWSGWRNLIGRGRKMKNIVDKLKIGMYESHFWQHESLTLVLAA